MEELSSRDLAGSLLGAARFDLDGDGIHDPAEFAAEGTSVILYDANGTQIATTTVSAGGQYSFANLSANGTGGPLSDFTLSHVLVGGSLIAVDDTADTADGYAGLAINETFERKDDIGFKDMALPVSITYHSPSTSAGVPSTRSHWLTIQVETPIPNGNGATEPSNRAELSNDPNATSGSSTLQVQMVDGQTTTFYVITKITSDMPDDIVLVAYQHGFDGNGQSNPTFQGAGTTKVGTGEIHGIKVSMGYGKVPGAEGTVGIVDGEHTPKQMRDAGKYRIPPRVWTDLWAKLDKNVAIPEGKEVWTVLPANTTDYQTPANGKAHGRYSTYGVGDKQGWAQFRNLDRSEQLSFVGGVATAQIRGWTDPAGTQKDPQGKQIPGKVYQTEPGNSGKLYVAVYAKSVKQLVTAADWQGAGLESQGFSVAAIPISTTLEFLTEVNNDPKSSTPAGTWNLIHRMQPNNIEQLAREGYRGAVVLFRFEMDSGIGQYDDGDRVLVTELIKVIQNQYGGEFVSTSFDTAKSIAKTDGKALDFNMMVMSFARPYQNSPVGLKKVTIRQGIIWWDKRTDARAIPIVASGSEIEATFKFSDAHVLQKFEIARTSFKTRVDG